MHGLYRTFVNPSCEHRLASIPKSVWPVSSSSPLPTSASCFETMEPMILALNHVSRSFQVMKVQILGFCRLEFLFILSVN